MGELLNLIGLSTGVGLYAMLLVMVVRAGRGRPGHVDPLLLTTALLGLVWNLSALPAYELPKLGIQGPFLVLTAIGFSALGFLPAVVVQSVLRGEQKAAAMRVKLSIAVTAYAAAAVAAALHVRAAWMGDPLPSVFGMRLLTYAFVVLVVPLFAVTRNQPGSRRALWAAALSIFAVSSLHLSQFHQGDSSWPVELLGHHASLPLAFAILYQDFPFALADLFLKRALTLLAVVTAAFVAVVNFSRPADAVSPLGRAGDIGILVALWVATALLYPRLRQVAGWFVDSIVLDRPDYESLLSAIGHHARRHQDIESVMDDACAQLAPALSARSVRWHKVSSASGDRASLDDHDSTGGRPDAAAVVTVPVAEPPGYSLEVSDLTGGRRLLSDDRAALDAIALLLGRRIDALRLTRERYDRQLREQEMGKLATEAELRALRAQINPHFLFNALTTIGYLIQTAPPRALQTLMRLTSLLRAVLRSEGELTTLGREVEVIEAYLDIERARFEQRLAVTIDVPAALRAIRVPPLVLQPLVENAVKHGIAPLRLGGAVTVCAALDAGPGETGRLILTVQDTGAGASATALARGRASGVGLQNVERRLEGQFGPQASLTVESTPGRGTVAEIRIPVRIKDIVGGDSPQSRMVM